MDLGHGNHESYEDTQPFLLSLERLVRLEDLDFVLESNHWNFLTASWVMDSRMDPQFDFTMSVNIRNRLIKRRVDLQTGGHRGRSIDDYGREITRNIFVYVGSSLRDPLVKFLEWNWNVRLLMGYRSRG